MKNNTLKKNKALSRSVVVLGTLLAGSAIWLSVIHSGTSASSAPLSVVTPVNNNSSAIAPAQTAIAGQTAVQQVVPRLRTRGS